jgi:signal transduction histidine kinase/DNA-binding response OmpR family regulator
MSIQGGVIHVCKTLLNRGSWPLVLRGATTLSIMGAAGGGIVATLSSQTPLRDAHSIAIGLAVLLGFACGAICVLLARNRTLARALSSAHDRVEDLSDKNWELTGKIEAGHDLVKARDEAEAANRAKSRFLATVSHEIRTPLNGILGMADLLFDTGLTPEQKTYVKAVRTSGDTLLSLVDEILDFSRIEAGRIDLDARLFDLTALVEETVELLAPRAAAKDLEIASYVDGRLPRCLIGDAARLRQILLNLAGNAIKFTEKGGIAIEVEPGPGHEVMIAVRDTGIGIPLEQQARIFLDFQQGDTGPARKTGGAGLGLAICRLIIERMGGRIAVESRPGAGSVFRVAVALPPALSAAAATVAPPDLAGKHILIVAGTPVESPLLARHLAAWGAKTCVVRDPIAAGKLMAERAWHAHFVDHGLGRGACDALARAAGEVAHRIILLRPSARHELPALKAAGFSGYLIKPVRAASLAARLTAKGADFERSDADAASDAKTSEGHPRGLAVLVAEDNEINALLARALLVKLGHRPAIAADGTAAIEAWLMARAAGEPFGVVLMDVRMSETDGIEATRRIRAAEAACSEPRTPIIGLTASAFAEDRDACLEAGMDGVLVKPLDRERLADALAALMARRLAA